MTRPHLTVAHDLHHLSTRATLVLAAAAAFSLMACGGSSGGGTGGAPGIGGSPVAAAGGHTGTGGRGTGGTGTGGSGGFISAACGAPPYTHTSGFGAILDGWVVAGNSTPAALAPVLGLDGSTTSGTIVEIDPTDGSPVVNGSVKLTIPFTGPSQEMLFAQNMNGLNMAGTTVTAQIKLDSGLNTGPVNVGRAFLILKTTVGYNYVSGPVVSLDSSAGWVELTINTDNPGNVPPGYDPCDVREIDVSVQTGGAGTYTTAVVHIDTIAVTHPGASTDGGVETGADAVTPTDATDAPASTDAIDAPPATDTATDVQTDATPG